MEQDSAEDEYPLHEEQNGERHVLDWPKTEVDELLLQVEKVMPKTDRISFIKRIPKLKWEDIHVGDHDSQECRTQFMKIVEQVRSFRLLHEIMQDVKEWVNSPASSELKMTDHPDFPKAPPTLYMRFHAKKYPKLRAKHPDMSMVELTKKICKRWKKMSAEHRKSMQKDYDQDKAEYEERKRAFYQRHPEYVREKKKTTKRVNAESKSAGGRRRAAKGENKLPALPKSPFEFFLVHRFPEDLAKDKEEKKTAIEKLKDEWGKLKAKKKAKYIEEAIADEARYETERAHFLQENPDGKLKRHLQRVSQAERDMLDKCYGRPKAPHPKNGYSLFCSEFHATQSADGEVDNKVWMKAASIKWKTLSEEEKDEFNTRLEELKKKYRDECDTYLQNIKDDNKRENERKLLFSKVSEEPSSNNLRNRKKRPANGASAPHSAKKAKVVKAPGRILFQMESEGVLRTNFPGIREAELKNKLQQMYDELKPAQKRQLDKKAAEKFI